MHITQTCQTTRFKVIYGTRAVTDNFQVSVRFAGQLISAHEFRNSVNGWVTYAFFAQFWDRIWKIIIQLSTSK